MRIPQKIKIGAKIYTVEKTKNISLGSQYYSGEIDFCDMVIRVYPNAQRKMEADLLHEMLHGIADFLGYKKHDEKRIDELANALHMVILDNPELFMPEEEQTTEGV